jgi:hypothetical protein
MNHIKQRVPNWADVEPKHADFETLENLLKIDWVERWATHPKFHQFSISTEDKYESFGGLLMVELEEGTKWWVIGFLRSVEGLSLPEWEK